MKKKILAALIAALVIVSLGFFVSQARADVGPHYVLAAETGWVDAGDDDHLSHIIYAGFNPLASNWKMETRTRCDDGLGTSDEWVTTEIYKGNDLSYPWRSYTAIDSSDDPTPGVTDHPYPGGIGEDGFNTPNFNGEFDILITTPQWSVHGSTQPRCEFRAAFYDHEIDA